MRIDHKLSISMMFLALTAACGGARVEPATVSDGPDTGTSAPAPGDLPVSTGPAFHAFLPRPVTSFGAAVAGGRLYVLGGYDGTPHAYTPAGQSGELWSVDLATGRDWRSHPGTEGLQGLALVTHGERVCRFGGMRADGSGAVRSIAEAACFDPARGAWSDLPSLPDPRSSHDAIVVGDVAYVVGGWKLEGAARGGAFHDTMLALDLAHPERGWREAEVPFARRGLGIAAIGARLIVVGGMEASGDVSRRVDVLELPTGAWSRGPDVPGDAFGVAVVGEGDRVVASGRDGAVHALPVGDALGSWEPVGSLAFPRFFHRLVVRAPGEVLALGGIRGMTDAPRTAHIESVVLGRDGPRTIAMELAHPGRARNRQGMFLEGDRLHAFGGNVSLEQHDFEEQHFTAEHQVLDLPSMTWSRAADYPFARQTIQTVVTDARGIAIGGFGHEGGDRGSAARTHPESFDYDFAADRWTARAPLPVSRSQFGLAQHGDRLWVFGGLDYDPAREGQDAFRHLTEILSGPIDGALERAPIEMSSPRRAFGGAVLGDRYYVVGGMAGEFELVTDCRAFDFTEARWSEIACPRAPRLNPQLVALGERLYLVGGTASGEGGLAPARSIEVYDPGTNAWSVLLEDAGIEPRHLRAFALRDRLVLFSTHSEDGLARVVMVDVGLSSSGRQG